MGRWMDKKAVVHIHNGILLGHWKECIWISSNEVDETGAYYTEWSKSERKTPIQYTNAYIWNLERCNDNPICKTEKETQMHRTVFWTLGEGEGGVIWETSIETCILSYVKQIASPGSMHATGCSGLVHWDDLKGWDGEGAGSGVQDGEHMCSHGWFMSKYGKNHYNIVK